jgi:hypothetical protein
MTRPATSRDEREKGERDQLSHDAFLDAATALRASTSVRHHSLG